MPAGRGGAASRQQTAAAEVPSRLGPALLRVDSLLQDMLRNKSHL